MPRLESLGHRVRQVLRDIHVHLTVNVVGDQVTSTSSAPDLTEDSHSVDFEIVSVPAQPDSTTTSPRTAVEATVPWWERETEVSPSGAVLALVSQIGSAGSLSAVDRIALAYQRGRQAAQIRRGEIFNYWGNRCNLKNRCYIVLRGGVEEEPFFTWHFPEHQRAVRTDPGGGIAQRAISHGFPSQTEALAFCLGAGLDSLPRTA